MTAYKTILTIICSLLFISSFFMAASVANSRSDDQIFINGIDTSGVYGKDALAPWWNRWAGDKNQNGLEDQLDELIKDGCGRCSDTFVEIMIDYDHAPNDADIDKINNLGIDITYIDDTINLIAAENVPLSLLPEILKFDGVVMIEKQSEWKPLLDTSVPAMKVSESSSYNNIARDFDVTGEGITIAIIDTGVDDDHDSLDDNKYVAGEDFSDDRIKETNPDDKEGHGTHVAGIALGNGGSSAEFVGVAPDAKLVDVKVFDDWSPTTSSSNIMEALDWCINNKVTYGIDILSMSIGEVFVGNDDGQSAEARKLDEASAAGLVVVVAAGNEGPNNNGFSSFAAAESVITVGAVDDKGTVNRDDDDIADFSNRGPRADDGDMESIDEFKPDVCAPGVNINSAQYAASIFIDPGNLYWEKSGTSMSAPHIAGLAALIMEANPNLGPADVKTVIRETASSRGSPYNNDVSTKYNKNFGWGIADGYEAVKRAKGDFQRAEVLSFQPGDTIGGTIDILGEASNDKGSIEKVELSFDSGRTWEEASGTYDWEITWDTSKVINGNFVIFIRTHNGTSFSDIFKIPVVIKNILAQISYPYDDSKLKGKVTIEGSIPSRETVHYVEIRIDEGDWELANDKTGVGEWSTWFYDWNTKSASNGEHTIYVRTHVDSINSAETSIKVRVDNKSDDSPGFVGVVALIAIAIALILIVVIQYRNKY